MHYAINNQTKMDIEEEFVTNAYNRIAPDFKKRRPFLWDWILCVMKFNSVTPRLGICHNQDCKKYYIYIIFQWI